MSNINFNNSFNTLSEIGDLDEILTVRFPHAVKCEIDISKRTATVPRLELKLRGTRPIGAGWTAKIQVLSGINRRFTLGDAIVLPTITPGQIFPIGGGTTEIPNDLVRSHDEWSLEFYIVDPTQKSQIIYRSLAVSFL